MFSAEALCLMFLKARVMSLRVALPKIIISSVLQFWEHGSQLIGCFFFCRSQALPPVSELKELKDMSGREIDNRLFHQVDRSPHTLKVQDGVYGTMYCYDLTL